MIILEIIDIDIVMAILENNDADINMDKLTSIRGFCKISILTKYWHIEHH